MYIRIKDEILDYNTNKCIYVIRDSSKESENCYVSYHWDNWRKYFLIDYQNCILFSYNSAQSFISDLIQENLEYQNLVIELSPYYKDCKQADTIEELCDEFVLLERNSKPRIFETLKGAINNKIYEDEVIYGAIWTDKGLQFVARMHKKGGLELI